jgi:hypothetical protein
LRCSGRFSRSTQIRRIDKPAASGTTFISPKPGRDYEVGHHCVGADDGLEGGRDRGGPLPCSSGFGANWASAANCSSIGGVAPLVLSGQGGVGLDLLDDLGLLLVQRSAAAGDRAVTPWASRTASRRHSTTGRTRRSRVASGRRSLRHARLSGDQDSRAMPSNSSSPSS